MNVFYHKFRSFGYFLHKTGFFTPHKPQQNLYLFLLIGDVLYYVYNITTLSANYFQKNIISLIISLFVFSLFYLFGPQKKFSNSLIRYNAHLYIYVLFNLTYLCLGLEQPSNHIEREFLLDLQIESLWRFLMLDLLTSNLIMKLVYALICLKAYMTWRSSMHFRLICIAILLLMHKKAFRPIFREQKKFNRPRKEKSPLEQDSNEDFAMEKTKASLPLTETVEEVTLEKSEAKYSDQDCKLLAKILSSMPEGVIVLGSGGQIKYMNEYMKNIFEFDEGISLKELSQNMSKFELKEASIQVTNKILINKGPLEDVSRDSMEDRNDKLTKEEFLKKVQEITSLEDLFNSCYHEPEPQEVPSKYVPTFQTRYHNQHDNEWYSMEVKAHLLIENPQERNLIILWRDTTERENKIIYLEEERVTLRNNILASFSHELRTPLNSNLAFLEQTMDSYDVPYKVKERLIKPALTSGKLLFFLIKDILDYSQMVLNRLDIHVTSRSINQTVNQCVELFQEKITQKELELRLNIDKRIPHVVFTDHDRFAQILINLLSNAVKFTTKGSIEINLEITRQHTLLVSVKDTGVGMDKAAQEKLKLKLEEDTIPTRVNSDSVGIGIGCFIASKLAKRLSPKESIGIDFLSEKGKGSYFFFEMENKKPGGETILGLTAIGGYLQHYEIDERCDIVKALNTHQTHLLKNSFRLNQRNAKRTLSGRALVVDDEIFNIIVIENFCRSFGITIEKAFHGEEAIAKLKANQDPDDPIKMIFMDINMPVMDGYEASLAITDMLKKGQIAQTVIIGVTAYVAGDMISKCFKCGMSEVLNKPVSKDQIVDILKKYEMLE